MNPTTTPPLNAVPNVEEFRKRAQATWGIRPCLWQVEVAQAILRRKADIISIAGTGMGKTLTFWLPFLFSPNKSIQIIVTPLNLLGEQQVKIAEKLGLRSIFISSDTSTTANWEDISSGVYRVVIINPEMLMKTGGGFEKAARDPSFHRRIISIILDEGHCISTWASFRKEYKEIGVLSYTLPPDIPRLITTATLTASALSDIKKSLHLRSNNLKFFSCSTDRPNINLTVKKIQSPLTSFQDLSFVLQGFVSGTSSPDTFLIFFDDINESIAACRALRKSLPREYHEKILWFNSDMTDTYKKETMVKLLKSEIWGLFTTDSFGMGIDMPHIKLVVQWRATCSVTALWQRIGRAGRDREIEATAVFLVEKKYFDDEKAKKENRKSAKDNGQRAGQRAKRPRQSLTRQAEADQITIIQEIVPVEDFSDRDLSSDEDNTNTLPTVPTPVTTTKVPAKRSYNGRVKNLKEIEPAMDMIINAKQRKLACIRIPIKQTFTLTEADNSNKHLLCDSSRSDGCPRCRITPPNPALCCDIHNSPAFHRFASNPIKANRPPNRAQVPKYTMEELDHTLYQRLDTWREQKTIEMYGWENYDDLGSMLVLPTESLQRIIDCARSNLLLSRDELLRQVRWDNAPQFATEIMELVHSVRPLAPVSPAANLGPPSLAASSRPSFTVQLKPNNTNSLSAVQPAQKKERQCRKCGIYGHNSRNLKYHPLIIAGDEVNSSKENHPIST